MRLHSVALLLAAFALPAATASAIKPARACIDAHAEGQVERDAGRLLRARERFLACAAEPCPAMIREECLALNEALTPLLPSVLLVAQDTAGKPMNIARTTIDGNHWAAAGRGTPVELDPGLHHFDVVLADGRRQTFDLSLRQSEKSRRVVAMFDSQQPAKSSASSGNALAYVLGGVGLLALGTWGAFAWDGRSKQADLESCAPNCTSRSEVKAMRRSYLVADVMLAVSVATLGSSAYLLISNSATENRSAGRTVLVGAQGRF